MALKQFCDIHLYRGGSSILNVNLAEFDFQGGYVLFSLRKRAAKEPIFSYEMRTPTIHRILFSDEFTKDLSLGYHMYEWDLVWVVDEERYPQCAISYANVSQIVGGNPDESSV